MVVQASGKNASWSPPHLFRECPVGRRPRADPGPGGGIVFLNWIASGIPSKSCLLWPGKGKSGPTAETAASVNPSQWIMYTLNLSLMAESIEHKGQL